MKPEDIQQLLSDRTWRLNNLYFIKDKRANVVRFKMNWAQSEFHENKHTRNEILKVRQLGLSTYVAIAMLDSCLFRDNLSAGIVDKSLDDAQEKLEKIKFAYDSLDYLPDNPSDTDLLIHAITSEIKNTKQVVTSDKLKMVWNNGSSVRCGTSLRGGTIHFLHVSEFSYVALNAPIKAGEIISGAFNAVPTDGIIVIESTHMGGKYGKAYKFIKESMENVGKKHSPLDYKFFFFPWWKQKEYSLELEGTQEFPVQVQEYFNELEKEGIVLNEAQKNWYFSKMKEQDDDMKREYPSTPDEALSTSVEGAIYGKYISKLRSLGMTNAEFIADSDFPVYVAYDIGVADFTSLWFFQVIAGRPLFLDYQAYNDLGLQYGVDLMNAFERKHHVKIKYVVLPHDASQRDKVSTISYDSAMNKAGYSTVIVPKTSDIWLSIGIVKELLPHCTFHARCNRQINIDDSEYLSGIESLENYKRRAVGASGEFRNEPLHDACSHGADAFRTAIEAIKQGLIGGSNVGTDIPKIQMNRRRQNKKLNPALSYRL